MKIKIINVEIYVRWNVGQVMPVILWYRNGQIIQGAN